MTLTLSEVQAVRATPGSPRHFVGFIRDLSELEQLVHSLESKSQQVEAIFDSVRDALIVTDGSGEILTVNSVAGLCGV